MFVQDGFLYLIVTRHKLTVHAAQINFGDLSPYLANTRHEWGPMDVGIYYNF
jgi:hypothetical protein